MPLDRSTTWPYEDGEPGRFFYQRYAHPAGVEAEAALSRLEGGHALLFPSGAGATTALALAHARARGHDRARRRRVLRHRRHASARSSAGGSATSSTTRPARRPTTSSSSGWRRRRTRSSRSPTSRRRSSARTRRGRASSSTRRSSRRRSCGRSSTAPTSSLHSATKALAGHDDVLLGVVVCRDDGRRRRGSASFRGRTGIVAAPDPAWLLLRGLETLELRVRRQSATALELARRLGGHPAVERVRYPGLGDAVAARYLDAFGCLLSFDVRGGAEAARAVETRDARDRERHEPRRHALADRDARALGGRARARPTSCA